MLTAARLREVLHYDPATGLWRWLVTLNNFAKAGSIAGTPDKKGYIRIVVDRRSYAAHRLAWFYMTGEWPPCLVDHRDLNKARNVWSNLRLASNSQNGQNSALSSRNSTGYKRVCWHKRLKKYQVAIKVDGKQLHLGTFDDPKVAHEAYVAAAIKYYGEFARAA